MKFRSTAGIAGVVAVMALAGCATSSNSPSSGNSDTPTGVVHLKFQSLAFQDPTVAASKKIVADWNAANPDIQVEYVQGSWDSVHDQLVTQFQGGTAPDIIHDEAADIAGFAEQGYLADLTPYLSADTKSSVAQGVWDTVTVGGKIVGAPTLLQSYMVFANTDMLTAAGITVPTGESWSWDDFAAAAKAATTGGKYGVGWGLKSPTATVMSLGLNFGGTFFTGDGDAAKISIGDNELAVPQRIHDMAYVDKSIDPTSLSQSGGDVMPGFLAGDYAMTVQGSYAAQTLIEQAPATFHWAVLPPLSGDSADQAADPQTLSVSAASPHAAQAGKFVDYFMKAENLAAVAEGDWLIPTSDAARQAVATETKGDNGWTQTLASGADLTKAPFQSATSYPQWKDQIATPAFQKYFANQIDLTGLQKALTDGWASVGGAS